MGTLDDSHEPLDQVCRREAGGGGIDSGMRRSVQSRIDEHRRGRARSGTLWSLVPRGAGSDERLSTSPKGVANRRLPRLVRRLECRQWHVDCCGGSASVYLSRSSRTAPINPGVGACVRSTPQSESLGDSQCCCGTGSYRFFSGGDLVCRKLVVECVSLGIFTQFEDMRSCCFAQSDAGALFSIDNYAH